MDSIDKLRVCLVTGGTSGIGLATVKRFHAGGYRIATCGRNVSRLERVRCMLQSDSDDHFVAEVDLTDIPQTVAFGQAVLKKLGRVDVLINNAAKAPLAEFTDLDLATLDSMIDVNIRSPFALTQLIWRSMVRQGINGVVVNLSSLAAIDPFPGFSVYGASKAWLDLMSLALAGEGALVGIRVYSIRAGAVETPMLRGLFPDFPAEQCVAADDVADLIWNAVNHPDEFPSGQPLVIAQQT